MSKLLVGSSTYLFRVVNTGRNVGNTHMGDTMNEQFYIRLQQKIITLENGKTATYYLTKKR